MFKKCNIKRFFKPYVSFIYEKYKVSRFQIILLRLTAVVRHVLFKSNNVIRFMSVSLFRTAWYHKNIISLVWTSRCPYIMKQVCVCVCVWQSEDRWSMWNSSHWWINANISVDKDKWEYRTATLQCITSAIWAVSPYWDVLVISVFFYQNRLAKIL